MLRQSVHSVETPLSTSQSWLVLAAMGCVQAGGLTADQKQAIEESTKLDRVLKDQQTDEGRVFKLLLLGALAGAALHSSEPRLLSRNRHWRVREIDHLQTNADSVPGFAVEGIP